MITQRYNINLTPNDGNHAVVRCSQYDRGSRIIDFSLYNNGSPFYLDENDTISVRGTKKDGTGFEFPCENNISSVSFLIQEQMTLFAGKIPCELRIIRGTEVLGSMNFVLNVEVSPLNEEAAVSETTLPYYESLLLSAQAANFDPPTTDGTYTLAVTVEDGEPTYSWIGFILD